MGHDRALKGAGLIVPLLVFVAVYGSAAGHGFIADDFGWIIHSRVGGLDDLLQLFTENRGFYRPVVALSFAVDYQLFGLNAIGYGWTNLLLALVSGALIASLLRTLRLPPGAALFGALVWLFNVHGINMAVLWLSGRTALLLVIGALIAVIGTVRSRPTLALFGFAFAMFSKEEAVVIPVLCAAVHLLRLTDPPRRGQAAGLAAAAIGVLIVYAILRTHAGAMVPGTAPSYYRFTFAPAVVWRNVLEYANRAAGFAIASGLIAWLVLGPDRLQLRNRLLAFGGVWIVAGYAVTVWLPVRSSLYACFPSVGAALMAATFADACWRSSSEARRRWAVAALVLLPVACTPIYAARNQRWTSLAELSSRTLDDVEDLAAGWPDDTWLVLVDDRSTRVNLQSAFGTLIAEAIQLRTGRATRVWIEPPLEYAALAGMTPPCAGCPTRRLLLRDGHLVAAQEHGAVSRSGWMVTP